jgi:hypothetical protein
VCISTGEREWSLRGGGDTIILGKKEEGSGGKRVKYILASKMQEKYTSKSFILSGRLIPKTLSLYFLF